MLVKIFSKCRLIEKNNIAKLSNLIYKLGEKVVFLFIYVCAKKALISSIGSNICDHCYKLSN